MYRIAYSNGHLQYKGSLLVKGACSLLSQHTKYPSAADCPSPPTEPELQAHCMLQPVRIRIPPIPMFSVLVLVASVTQTALLAPLARTQWDGDNRALSVPFSPTLLTPICDPCNSFDFFAKIHTSQHVI